MKYRYYVNFECNHQDVQETLALLTELLSKQLTGLGATNIKPCLQMENINSL